MDELKLKEAKGKAQRKIASIETEIGDLCALLVKCVRAEMETQKAIDAYQSLIGQLVESRELFQAAIAQPEPTGTRRPTTKAGKPRT